MKKGILFFFLTMLFAANFSFAQYAGLSHAIMTATGTGQSVEFTNPYTNSSQTSFAGLIVGTVDGHTTLFYCSDLRRTLNFPDTCHVDSAAAPHKLIYILNNYYPYNPNPPGKLSDINKEAAATQFAIWKYTDGVNANTIQDNNQIKNRALAIIAAAEANGGSTLQVTTLSIEPGIDPDDFIVRTLDQDGDGIAVNNIVLTISEGSLSTNTTNTTAPSGESPPITVSGSTGIITATAEALIPQATTYTCTGRQRMLLASPVIGRLRVEADWGALPVELTSFAASVSERSVTLNWSTVSERNNSGFNIERKNTGSEEWTTIGNVAGHGTISVPQNYAFTDRNLSSGSYNYRLKQIDYNGNFEYFNLSSEVEIGTPSKFNMSQNYPNPFNPTTNINYSIAGDGFVSIKIFDNLGREVATLVNEYKTTGHYSVDFSGANLTSGLYFYRMEANGFMKVMKMSLIK